MRRRLAILAGLLFSAAGAQAAEIRVITPSVSANAGLRDLAASFTAETGIKVNLVRDAMAKTVDDAEKGDPPADVVMLPTHLMDQLEKDGAAKPGSRSMIGRVEVGLAVKAGAPHPDISTVPKLVAVLKSANAVMYSNPYHGSYEAEVIDRMLKRPEFLAVHGMVATRGEGGSSLAHGEGDMALQIVDEIYPYPEISLVGILPPELNAHVDMELAISSRAQDAADAAAFVRYILRPDAAAVWKAKGLDRR